MTIITQKLRTLLLLSAAALLSVCWLGCGGGSGGNPSSGGGGDTGGNTTHTHTWGEWVVTTAPTCDAPGVETRTCTQDASHKETREVAKLSGAACESGGGGSYDFVTLGGKKWMKKNLNIETADSWCYNNSADSCNKYGRLYTWAAAKSACQSVGWRLPDTSDWRQLVVAAGGDMAGKALKSRSGWYNNGNGTDSYGFSALPGGGRYTNDYFNNAGSYGLWWTVSENGSIANSRYMNSIYDFVIESLSEKSFGLSVRCVAD